MNKSRAIIVVSNEDALRVVASSARISTQQGTAMEIYDKSKGDEKDLRLVNKVLASGHKSVIEHQTFGIAFDDVSVLVEQFVIECRLASFTVKSRRYVDFSEAGFVAPEGLTEAQHACFDAAMKARFADYEQLMALGVPKEDARFVLPYSLRSNFFMTVDARELIGLICAMLYGRGKGFPEVEALGCQLKEQFDRLYPGVIDGEAKRYPHYEPMPLPGEIKAGADRAGDAELIDAPKDTQGFLNAVYGFTGRFSAGGDSLARFTDARPREMEMLHYTFKVKRVSLACVTHFTRHRMVSLLVPPVSRALAEGDYVLPETVKAIPEAEAIYRRAFEDQAAAAKEALALGMSMEDASYFAMSGHQLDLMISMNLREMIHFMKLRTCRRAQWEIQGVAWKMLKLLVNREPEVFTHLGPSCVYGPCPEGRMSCGHPYKNAWEE
ncbi:MAG: FAD-dependent thymidylate synthase [Clostridia bacterium]|nr:FAD-dependent thymidylate synthase [Clostridia bacterium]